MLYLQQPALLRVRAHAWVAALGVVTALSNGEAIAQSAATLCYEFIPARANIEPPAPMLIDKCSGRTWLLMRSGRAAYRWTSIATDTDKPKMTDRLTTDAAPSGGGSPKCFTFNNRKFCE